MALEGLYVAVSAPWYAEFRSELLGFPAGKHDDQVDALGLIGQLLDQMVPGQAIKEPPKPKVDTGYRPLPLGFSALPDDGLVDVVFLEKKHRRRMLSWLDDNPEDAPSPLAVLQGHKVKMVWHAGHLRINSQVFLSPKANKSLRHSGQAKIEGNGPDPRFVSQVAMVAERVRPPERE
jgi:hypothetical protein